MKRWRMIIWILLIFAVAGKAQQNKIKILGEVTFVTSRSVYIRFDNTEKIQIGDTLYFEVDGIENPCLLIDNKSSSSVVGKPVRGCKLEKGFRVIYYDQLKVDQEEIISPPTEVSAISEDEFPTNNTEIDNSQPIEDPYFQQRIRGRMSAASYSNFSSEAEARHRTLYRFSLNANHINNSGLSLESYLNYRQDFRPETSSSILDRNQFRVYNMALKYEVDSTATFTLGRKINYKASSLGAIDGLQVEKYFGHFYTGAIIGFRPDFVDYGFNPDLLEYGGYIGYSTPSGLIYSQTTLGLLEQRYAGAIDRRYAYFQHSSNLNRKVNIFSSFELDLYENINGVITSNPRLTNLYVSLRYRMSRKFDFTVSYDSRRRIIYYETLKTDLERLLDEDEARQGIRLRMNFKPIKYVYGGVSYSKRFQSSNQNKSDNINGYLSFSRLPELGGRLSVNYNWNKSNYLDSKIMSFRYSRDIIDRKLSGDFYFRVVNYAYISSEVNFAQKYYGANFYWRLNRKWRLSILGEMAVRSIENNYRINTKLLTRFGK